MRLISAFYEKYFYCVVRLLCSVLCLFLIFLRINESLSHCVTNVHLVTCSFLDFLKGTFKSLSVGFMRMDSDFLSKNAS